MIFDFKVFIFNFLNIKQMIVNKTSLKVNMSNIILFISPPPSQYYLENIDYFDHDFAGI